MQKVRIEIQGGATITLHGPDAEEMIGYLSQYGTERELFDKSMSIDINPPFVKKDSSKTLEITG